MIKKSAKELAEDEMKILTELHYHGKENIEALAKHCGFSIQKTRRMIKQLEDRRIIWGYTAVTDLEKMNQRLFMMLIRKENKPVDEKTSEKINSIDLEDLAGPLGLHIVCSYFAHGMYDWIVIYTGSDFLHARRLCDTLNTEFPGYIKECNIEQILYSTRKQYIINPDRKKLHELME